ncbi:suppressor of fused domain protein [Cellulomonas persica]|uniref:Suppressor of fused-like domain-containing protein n=1 Tax=Cellulomonas persica TaxID=76861 RepID=A0A510UWM3_9CELL|nr:suppressor of fused domain protein [Cellulomonas persica]GEK19087.1 hypothetical protein CPE01_28200 [Cellulomonas persica]
MPWWRGRRDDAATANGSDDGGADGPPLDDGEPTACGWDAIDAACQRLYGDQTPRHVGYSPGRAFGSVLQGCSAYRADNHWHYVTYGLSNLFDDDEGDNDGLSGWGYELTWRVRDTGAEAEAPAWPFAILQRLAKWASDSGVLLAEGSRLAIGTPVTGYPHTDGPDTPLVAVLLATDPELGEIDTPNGRVRFLQFVAVDAEALARAREENLAAVLDHLRAEDPLLVTSVGT